jgi:hypothetical protein
MRRLLWYVNRSRNWLIIVAIVEAILKGFCRCHRGIKSNSSYCSNLGTSFIAHILQWFALDLSVCLVDCFVATELLNVMMSTMMPLCFEQNMTHGHACRLLAFWRFDLVVGDALHNEMRPRGPPMRAPVCVHPSSHVL